MSTAKAVPAKAAAAAKSQSSSSEDSSDSEEEEEKKKAPAKAPVKAPAKVGGKNAPHAVIGTMSMTCLLIKDGPFCMQAPVKQPAAPGARKKDSSSSSEESDSEDEQPAKAPAASKSCICPQYGSANENM